MPNAPRPDEDTRIRVMSSQVDVLDADQTNLMRRVHALEMENERRGEYASDAKTYAISPTALRGLRDAIESVIQDLQAHAHEDGSAPQQASVNILLDAREFVDSIVKQRHN